ncbi:MAG: Thymidylate synthase, flavin-dependent [Candidatus Collierbacteria bacterium GW2011_GWB1_45_35]|uniref:Flavin-dependent thymidylate synthase n=2 Tax=Candidatus Collieribacteriota TaxID=1752725 RepID=A0A0G1KSN8_9BACT|nr:MAG: Thymidylate synthase, flavin-dependent [Microgenomates group bacterium GW2011_GWC1_44_23]KKT86601.1 MAG: Thymidylate synthase, flavin-dependent [Candidatus Collierbacteria bacterium GW2011_GWA2_44_99]KKT96008.1 MAG: Thymidylate synthase, flavin-dependent [Candidatus Collierbacteria bacterium GW2011_GWA1_45_15]KKU01119.1 MAG: Thymidylate synthase, flavin-dependent [Candidatus Collierbacteria bacterium GW2011_GWB2_45_17]KKU05731.1 MAG: Thymidylate synthase, flavin-dependent [Candidatus Co
MLEFERKKLIETEIYEKPLPFFNPEVYETHLGLSYLREPGVAIISIPYVDLRGAQGFLDGFPRELEFFKYLEDPTPIPSSEALCKFAGQLCFLSHGPQRTMNKDAQKYFQNIKESGHGSVLEHANISILLWGVSRSLTHELVRHRAGFGFSQVSQRYVGGRTLRFIERPEYVDDAFLHELFEDRIERTQREYEGITDYLLEKQKAGSEILSADRKTDLRKKVRQAARSLLPNETEAPIVVTGNARAWRHFLNMRGSEHAEIEIRRAAFETYRCLSQVAPLLFEDFGVAHLPDGTHGLTTHFPKV